MVEPEFARVLAVAAREGSTLSSVIRAAWDDGYLRVMTRKDPLRATGAHISVLAHVTEDEVRRRLSDTEAANGFANRFLFLRVRRSKLLPAGEGPPESILSDLTARFHRAVVDARRVGRMPRSPDAEELWTTLYRQMADGPDGLVGAITARAEAQVLRLSITYALLDGSSTVGVDHLLAGYALWDYAEQSAAQVFGASLGDPVADRLLEAVRTAGAAGLDGAAQHASFGRHVSARDLDRARAFLVGRGLALTTTQQTGGRPRQVLVSPEYADANEASKANEVRLSSPRSLRSQDGEG